MSSLEELNVQICVMTLTVHSFIALGDDQQYPHLGRILRMMQRILQMIINLENHLDADETVETKDPDQRS